MICPRASCSSLTGTPSVLVMISKTWKKCKVGNKEGNLSSLQLVLSLLRFDSMLWYNHEVIQVMGHSKLVREDRVDVFWQSRNHGRLHGFPPKGKTTIGSGLGVSSSGTTYAVSAKISFQSE
jgi:hypothetical protein